MTKSLLLDKIAKTNWQEVKLGDLLIINPSERLSKGTIAKKVSMEKLQPFSRDVSGYELDEFSGGAKFRNKDTIMARITPCLENGKRAQINILKQGEVGFGSTEFIVFREKGNISDANFIYYLVCSDLIRSPAIKSMVGSSGRQRVQTDVLENLRLFLPPLDVQKKIAGVLVALDDKIELNNKINQNLEAQAQALFKSWFVDFEPFGGKMPDDWKIGKLGNFIEIKRGGSPRPIQNYISTSGLKWLKISDATSEISPYILTIKEYIKPEGLSKTVKLDAGSLVLSNSATPGIPKILDIESCIHDGWLYFPKSSFSNEYLYLLFKYIRNDLISLGNGSVFTNLKTDILKNFGIVIPSISVLNDFNKIIVSVFALIRKNRREIKNLIKLRDTLLPKLMSGEINVDDVKID